VCFENADNKLILTQALNTGHPGLVQLWNAQDEFGVASPSSQCTEYDNSNNVVAAACRQYFIRITNEATLSTVNDTRPEVFFSGALHGDERIGPNTVIELADLLVTNYASSSPNPWLKRMVDTRSIWIMPNANSIGYHLNQREENGIDPNRDFPFDQKASDCMQTTAARALNELFRRHLFQLSITYHGGMVMIAYEWGSPNHPSGQDVSPDNAAQLGLAKAMSQYGGKGVTSSNYPYGTLNGQVYPVHGGMEDWAYAASWDTTPGLGPGAGCTPSTFGGYPLSQTQYDPMMLRTFNVLVETSDMKGPPASHLGTKAAVLTPNGQGDGEIPRNIRLALSLVELVQPYVHWAGHAAPAVAAAQSTLDKALPLNPGTPIIFEWRVGGSIHVDSSYASLVKVPNCVSLDQATAESLAKSAGATHSSSQSGATEWQGAGGDKASDPLKTRFFATVTMPRTVGYYAVVLRAQVDQSWATAPGSAFPSGVSPQSHIVNARTKDASEWVAELGNQKVQVQKWWFSEPICVSVANTTNPYEWGSSSGTASGSNLAGTIMAVALVAAILIGAVAFWFYLKNQAEQGIGDSSLPHEMDGGDTDEGMKLCTRTEVVALDDFSVTRNPEAAEAAEMDTMEKYSDRKPDAAATAHR